MKYSPVVVPFRGKYLMTSHSNGLYIGDSPLGPFAFLGNFIRPDGSEYCPTDPALFVDDDGRLYLYAFWMSGGTHKRSFLTGTVGVELDGDNPRRLKTEEKLLFTFDGRNEWERFGEYRQDTLTGWIEGQWMYKRGGRYYLLYAASATEYSGYCIAGYISDEGPLSGFRLQKHNPIIEKRMGLLRGAGHGCIAEDSLWAFYTSTVAYTHIYERLIGMDRISVNADGELYAPDGATELPQYAQGHEPPDGAHAPGWLPLTSRQRAFFRASSHAPGHEGFYALDDSILTFWQPAADDKRPTLTVALQAPYIVRAVRLIWRDIGLDYAAGAVPGPRQYLIEAQPDADRGEWVTLLDARDNGTDLLVDYRETPPVSCEAVRLTVTGGPAGIIPGVISFTAFGTRDESI